ncbi:hypothetical protein [Bradyrhizobium diazoefficiens]|uniref:Uncharacterized protein n=1 Tax=Bradyrhizobium diazoefficiens TaxID=1355477 RepID=A0A809Z456_9BRAD|nr:hypothetical protein [Bradyrhizobium diazoefficiens]WLA73824.1 hypothetical protein QIH77_00880 [Bradyrhizobium diazoefficiens]BCE18078.1 hypothetical protein XF1B_07590 [Bradyrhizobium diazoefficiens]BCE44331.1 hypothetical protein XF4B_06800 [Bradyrhizobium diazoefficiens]BCE87876.1 hypothetical protein XF10B_06740 [Bradyrhizobium diazoefficiens]BCF22806.1 hypothetical protein XF14B_07580 [Bradyrhizobium diazoefficiens]
MPKSKKHYVIEHIFDKLFDTATATLQRTIVSADDIQEAKRAVNKLHNLGIKENSNPFNFMKDIVRGKRALAMWPESVRSKGYVGEQRTGGGAVFEFVPLTDSGETGFEDLFAPSAATPRFHVQSLSISRASKSLGRRDESWLLQVSVNLRIVETHLAVGNDKQIDATEVSHLQMDIKLRKVQIDALFLAHFRSEHGDSAAIITVEAKQQNQRILTEQVGRQVRAAFEATEAELVIPLALASTNEGIYVVEFKAVPRSALKGFLAPAFHREALYLLEPPVRGIQTA